MWNNCNHKIVIQSILNENELDLNSVNGFLYAATIVWPSVYAVLKVEERKDQQKDKRTML